MLLKSNNCILRTKGYSQLEMIGTSEKGPILNTITLPGFILDFTQKENGLIVVLGCNSEGNFVCR